jgi:serine/threonine-protein kinase
MTDAPEHLAGMMLADKYRLEAVLGVGGSGFVYRAEQLGLGRSVAVKILRPEYRRHEDLFRNEALAASRINHPNAITVYDFGLTAEGLPYLVMEHLRGRTLAAVLLGGRLTTRRALKVSLQILSALEAAHDCGVIHRDLKPENVILEPQRSGDDLVKVIDFGLAILDAGAAREIAGSPEYMAPEVIRGEQPTTAADLYAMGVMLWEMLVGRTPFVGGDVPNVLDRHLHAVPEAPLALAPVPRPLSDLCLQLLAKPPEARPPSAAALRTRLLDILAAAPDVDERACPACGAPSIGLPYCGRCGADLTTVADVDPAEWDERSLLSSRSTLAMGTGTQLAAQPLADAHTRTTRLTMRMGEPARPLIARAAERERLRRFYDGRGAALAMALVGPQGVGRSRLVLEVARERIGEVTTVCAGPDPSGARTSWYPVLSMLEAVLGLAAQPTWQAIADALGRAGLPARDAPGLAELFGVAGPLAGADPEVRRREARAAALRTLRATARSQGRCVLYFADVDHYDDPSAGLVDELAAVLGGTGIRMVVSTSSADRVPPGGTVVQVEPLGPDDARALTAALIGGGAEPPSAELVRSLTGGVPASIEQLAGWMAHGHSPTEAPSQLVDLLAMRITGLAPLPRRVLQALAAHGVVGARDLICATLGERPDDPAIGGAISDLVRQRLVVSLGSDCAIASPLLAELVRECTPADVRRDLHARALAAIDRGEHIAPAGVLAAHAEGAQAIARAHDLWMEAGRDAAARFDDRGAARLFSRATATARMLIVQGEAGTPERFVDAAVALADALRGAGDHALAAGILDEAELGGPPPRLLAGIARARGRLHQTAGNLTAARQQLRQAIALGMRGCDRAFLCQTYVDLAGALAAAGDLYGAIRELFECIQMVTLGEGLATRDATDRLWQVALHLAEHLLAVGAAEQAEEIALAALEHAGRDPHATGLVEELLARIADATGDARRGLTWRGKAIDVMRSIGDRRSTAALLIRNAESARALGLSAPSMTDDALAIAAQLERELDLEDELESS